MHRKILYRTDEILCGIFLSEVGWIHSVGKVVCNMCDLQKQRLGLVAIMEFWAGILCKDILGSNEMFE